MGMIVPCHADFANTAPEKPYDDPPATRQTLAAPLEDGLVSFNIPGARDALPRAVAEIVINLSGACVTR